MGANESNERLINDQYLLSELSSSRVTLTAEPLLSASRGCRPHRFFPSFFRAKMQQTVDETLKSCIVQLCGM